MDPSAPPWPVPPLGGRLVRPEPLSLDHLEDLVSAAAGARDSFGFTSVPDGPEAMTERIVTQLGEHAAGVTVPFAQVRAADGRAVGMTTFRTIRVLPDTPTPYAVEIGSTWLGAAAQRTGVNVEAKLLLLTFAFEHWGVARVDFTTDARNERSRQAIAGLGATLEGVLRNWQPSFAPGEQGRLRDSALYAITDDAWPAVRGHLLRRLSADESRPSSTSIP